MPERNINDDLGIGRVAAERSRTRFLNKDGSFNSRREGLGTLASLSVYYWLTTLAWPAFFGLLTLAFVGLNVVFAWLYMLCGPDAFSSPNHAGLENPFWRSFFFSVETLSTIGYGHIAPLSFAANMLATVEAYVGLLGVALATGLLFARFSKPVTRILFSEHGLIAPYQTGQAFMCRVVNGLRNEIMELEIQVTLARFELVNGERVRRFYPLALERDRVVFFPLGLTIVHPIAPEGPLWGVDEHALLESDAEFIVVLHGLDDTLFQRVHARSSYKAHEVVWNAKFSDMYIRRGDLVAIDANRLSTHESTG